ncbi:acyl-CoA dehydrogenase [Pseudobacter ginsenosidimutans]|uniref:Alkylation response protein AidB-like acyl-CoA dehydrogenase n=1 Tax=Pseudobacter ginsenosidimutans TaxID=661488 RepID=A0A4Q7MKA2_9BACT|nr:acyl-CoA dehydrogenase [Pseudobacter ginsenosidimutans]QEC45642.1 acyl-CoA dehydrogenase [Pseudobacter ginsenosidimutans]RZS67192.1 alkylation response protein AidB-like acyl-CoA dehydrogenase [Pseudobacter ginsenosidimutans]
MNIPFSELIATEAAEMIRNTAAASEQFNQLHPAQLELIYRNNWFNLFVPKASGGLELSFPEALQLEEALAWVDGSFGWTITLCSGANFFIGFLEPAIAGELFSNPKVCFAGSGAATGTAELKADGYHIAGHWKYATGAPHATVFTCVCNLKENGAILKDGNGIAAAAAFWLYPSEVKLQQDWNMMGMRATASLSFEAGPLIVPTNRRFEIDPAYAVLSQAVYRFPFLQFAEATLCANFSGMAMRFLELYFHHAAEPDKAALKLQQELMQARDIFYEKINSSWTSLLQQSHIPDGLLTEISKCSRELYAVCGKLMQVLYPAMGMHAAESNTEANRIWRNFYTASQHKLLREI